MEIRMNSTCTVSAGAGQLLRRVTTVAVGLGLAAGVGVGPAGAVEAAAAPAVGTSVAQAPAVMAAAMTDEQIEAYIIAVYSDLFGRTPDPVGLATWTTALASGVPLRAVADSITGSAEFRFGLIGDAYQAFLQRDPDPAGQLDWLNRMGRGLTIQQLAAGFLASAEYYNRSNPGNVAGTVDVDELAQWIFDVYVDVLEREPGDDEIFHWISEMYPEETGRGTGPGLSREQVAMAFLMSTERLSTDIDAEYQWLLGRGLDPAGQSTWVTHIQNGTRFEAVIGSIISSPEYLSSL
jgi:Domain of unknown function (DUF4214)